VTAKTMPLTRKTEVRTVKIVVRTSPFIGIF
jgi:hypothetical protein